MASNGPIAQEFEIPEPDPGPRHMLPLRQNRRPARLRIDATGIHYTFLAGDTRGVDWSDPKLSIMMIDYSACTKENVGARIGDLDALFAHPYYVLFRPSEDEFWMPVEVFRAIEAAVKSTGRVGKPFHHRHEMPHRVATIY
jgi:hypothetical protein